MSTTRALTDSVFCQPVITDDWLKEASCEETIDFLRKLALVHARQAGPYSETLQKYLESSDWSGIVGHCVDYASGSPNHLYHCRQSLAFFQKLEALPLGINKEQVAYEKFVEAEEQCRVTNVRLREARLRGGIQPTSQVASVLYTAQQKIASVLGDVPSLTELHCSFGPGANTSIKATASSARWKLNAQPTCSVELVPLLHAALRQFPSYVDCHRTHKDPMIVALENHLDSIEVGVEITPGNLQFVPKNAKTYRSIVVEPLINSWYQKGIGKYIRKRLRRTGIDIRTQGEKNKKLAQRASFDGSLATIDLSAASDTISQEIVYELLPLDWVTFLRSFRTGTVKYRGDTIVLQKFSSMGNAFTFELETLIFWSLAWACASVLRLDARETSAFGDDIIIPTGAVPLLFEVLDWCGFSVNSEKSYWSGSFRESCGGDYVSGIDIRPYYQKSLVSGQSLFVLHNYYVRTLQPEMANMVLAAIPESLRLWGPDGYGDGHLVGSWHAYARSTKKALDRGYGGVIFDSFSLKKRRLLRRLPAGDRLLPTYSIYVADPLAEDEEDPWNPGGYPWDPDDSPVDHYVVRGHRGYRRIAIYTLSTGVFIP